ncbi:MAG: T9SS type A sorting domain-containing protein [Ignavibacteria bacterium]|nr:T9SS type A sorting domain-containing protein [Ignavibacteria bacterium]
MKRFFKILIFFILTLGYCEVQSQNVSWEKLYMNGAIFRGIQTSDGGYAAVGTTRIQNQFKIFVVRTNSLGDTLWNKIFGSANNGFTANWIEESYDNGFVIAGYDGTGIQGDAYLLNIDSAGNYRWSRSYGGNGLDDALRVLKTIDGGYIIGARSDFNLFIIKTDSFGIQQWQKIFNSDGFIDLIQYNTSGYMVLGYSNGIGNRLFRLDLNGDTSWTKALIGNSFGSSLRRISDGNLIIGGSTAQNECVVTKTDSLGIIEWEYQYEGIGREIIYNLEIIPGNKGYLISGSTDSSGNDNFNAMIRVLDPDGKEKFTKYYSPLFYPSDYAEFRSGVPTFDGGFYLSGSIAPISTGIAYMVKTDSLGNFQPVGITSEELIVPDNFILYQNYPNPFNSSTNISFHLNESSIVNLIIYNVLGNEINIILNNEKFNSGKHSIHWNLSNESSGIYFYKITVKSTHSFKSKNKVKSMIILK